MDKVVIYLRKSRADEEIEKDLGQGETLAKHRKALLKYAREKELNIVKIYEEIVSGESIIHRPEMLKMLKEIQEDKYTSVLCIDMQRLGRGNMQEQGLILQTFKDHNVKIITLQKTYDLNNDFDEEYSEFEAFMSRKELKMINRRLQSGRIRSIEDGNYLSSNPPYGYIIHKEKHGRTLLPNKKQSNVVKMIFNMYTAENMGCGNIAHELNRMGYRSYTGKDWGPSAIRDIIKNPVYIGKITWKKKICKKSKNPDKIRTSKIVPRKEWIVVNGKHSAIIDKDIYNIAQDIINKRYHIPYKIKNGSRNPLAGIVICGVCGAKMVYRPYGKKAPHMVCPKCCGNKSSKFEYVEDRILQSLKELTFNINVKKELNNDAQIYLNQLNILRAELKELEIQKSKLYDLLERGVYSIDVFVERSKNISERIDKNQDAISSINSKISIENKNKDGEDFILKINNILNAYKKADINQKNKMLKSILDKAMYLKRKDQKNDSFSLDIYPNIKF